MAVWGRPLRARRGAPQPEEQPSTIPHAMSITQPLIAQHQFRGSEVRGVSARCEIAFFVHVEFGDKDVEVHAQISARKRRHSVSRVGAARIVGRVFAETAIRLCTPSALMGTLFFPSSPAA